MAQWCKKRSASNAKKNACAQAARNPGRIFRVLAKKTFSRLRKPFFSFRKIDITRPHCLHYQRVQAFAPQRLCIFAMQHLHASSTEPLNGPSVLEAFRNAYNASSNSTQHIACNAITHASPSKVLVDPRRVDALHEAFSNELDVETNMSDQEQSGRCWLFGFLNVVRAHMIHRYELDPQFELSQAYLFFWDQFEKANLFLHYMWKLRDKPTDDPHVREMLKEPISDGGQWHMIQNLVRRYGVVPKHCMGESYQANNTERMTFLLSSRLREFACALRTQHRGQRAAQLEHTVRPMMYEVYTILCVFLGEPPRTIRWEFNPSSAHWTNAQWKARTHTVRRMRRRVPASLDVHVPASARSRTHSSLQTKLNRKQGAAASQTRSRSASKRRRSKTHHHTHTPIESKPFEDTVELTPLRFYKEFVQVPINDYVTVINYPCAPDRPFHRRYTVKYLNNMVGGGNAELYNLPIETLKTLVCRSIDAGEPVWFCADINKDISAKYGILDPEAFNYQAIFGEQCNPSGWDKGVRMMYKDGVPNHAMVLRGYHTEPCGASGVVCEKVMGGAGARRRKGTASPRRRTRSAASPVSKPTRWLVENSWGDEVGRKGNLIMSDEWFNRHVYEIAVHKRHLRGLWKESPKQPIVQLEMWDVFGSLFRVAPPAQTKMLGNRASGMVDTACGGVRGSGILTRV